MMRFKLVWERSDKAVSVFKDFVSNGWRYKGAKIVRLNEVDIIDKRTQEVVQPAYVVDCVGSLFSYLRHKLYNPRGVFIGWSDPKA